MASDYRSHTAGEESGLETPVQVLTCCITSFALTQSLDIHHHLESGTNNHLYGTDARMGDYGV